MGLILGGTAYNQVAEVCLDTLQQEGLKQFAPKGISLDKWNPNTVYGYDHGRNQSFQTTSSSLVKELKAGFKAASCPIMDMTGFMQDYIGCSFAHHVMKCLLESNSGKDVAEIPINLSEIAVAKNAFHHLPAYDPVKIASFQEQWRKVNDSRSIALDTKDEAEQNFLSAKLAQNVSEILGKIDVSALVSGAVVAYNTAQAQAKASEVGLFSQSGAAGASLLASRAPAVDEGEDRTAPRHK